MNDNIDEIVDELALSLGTDAPFFRVEKDRLYLSGIEIAVGIAVGLVSSYLTGLYKGQERNSKKEERLMAPLPLTLPSTSFIISSVAFYPLGTLTVQIKSSKVRVASF